MQRQQRASDTFKGRDVTGWRLSSLGDAAFDRQRRRRRFDVGLAALVGEGRLDMTHDPEGGRTAAGQTQAA